MENMSYIYPIDTLSNEESLVWETNLVSRASEEIDLLTDFSTAEFLSRTLATGYSLSETQLEGVARFIADLVLKEVSTSQLASLLAQNAQVSPSVAAQIVREIETGLLEPLGLTLNGLTAPAQQPTVVQNAAGQVGLRYASLEDLVADITNLTPDERTQFLEDAKKDNRILVMQALSQLKLGTNSQGQPLSFRELVIQEMSQFDGQDWTDLVTANPDSLTDSNIELTFVHFIASPEQASALLGTLKTTSGLSTVADILSHRATGQLGQYWQDCPLGAVLRGREGVERQKTLAQFLALPSDTQDFLVAPETSTALASWVTQNIVPSSHRLAIPKLIAMVGFGDIKTEQLGSLLERLGLIPTQAAHIASAISELVPRVAPPAPQPLRIPPQTPTPSSPRMNTGIPQRNIIDLRRPQ